jgi:enoyl-CoA hydratase/carnithine racemase
VSTSPILVERDGPVGWLIFNRPDHGNALDARMLDELEAGWLALDADPEVRVIVNTGEGPAFCTGMDVVQLAEDKDKLREHSRRTRDATLRMTAWHLGIAKPVICAVNGVCAGGGLHFVVDADIVVAASDATFVDPHVSVGQAVAYEAIALLRTAAMEPIMRMALVGRHERLTADRAYELGILSQVVDPPTDLRREVGALARLVAEHPPEALAATKRALWAALESPGA